MLSMIVAMDRSGVIGLNNDLPWRLSADLQYFRRITMGKPIVMGRQTHESIGRALPGRRNIVLTRQADYTATGCEVVTSIEQALKVAADVEETMIMGGASLYEQFLPMVERLYVTRVHASVEGDTWFPEVTWHDWQLIDKQDHLADEKNQHNFSFEVYQRV